MGGAIGAGTDIVVWGMINCEFASVWPFHGAGGKTVVSRMSPPRYSYDGDGPVDARSESCPTASDEIATDRPDVTNSSLVVPVGSFQSEKRDQFECARRGSDNRRHKQPLAAWDCSVSGSVRRSASFAARRLVPQAARKTLHHRRE